MSELATHLRAGELVQPRARWVYQYSIETIATPSRLRPPSLRPKHVPRKVLRIHAHALDILHTIQFHILFACCYQLRVDLHRQYTARVHKFIDASTARMWNDSPAFGQEEATEAITQSYRSKTPDMATVWFPLPQYSSSSSIPRAWPSAFPPKDSWTPPSSGPVSAATGKHRSKSLRLTV